MIRAYTTPEADGFVTPLTVTVCVDSAASVAATANVLLSIAFFTYPEGETVTPATVIPAGATQALPTSGELLQKSTTNAPAAEFTVKSKIYVTSVAAADALDN